MKTTPLFLRLSPLVAFAWILTSVPCTVMAQDEASPRDFFEPGYVNKPGSNSGVKDQVKNKPAASESEPAPDTAEQSVQDRVNNLSDSLSKPGGLAGKAPQFSSSVKVVALGGILNAQQNEHFAKHIQQLADFIKPTTLKIGTVFCIGQKGGVPIPVRRLFNEREGRIVFADAAPDKYREVKTSPTWILIANDQEIVVEGFESLSEILTPRGDIIIKAQAKESPVPASGK